MPRFFVTASQIGTRDDGTKTVIITGEDASHITKSLRMKPGDALTVCDMRRLQYDCRVLSVGESVLLSVTGETECDTEPPYFATLYQALIKGDKFDTVVQKSVECGVSRIVPVLTGRCVVRLDKKEAAKKIARWQRIAAEAAKQCGRGIIPEVMPLMTFDEALCDAKNADIPLFCYEGETKTALPDVIAAAENKASVSLFVGSEGGFSADEAEKAVESGLLSVGLGRRILRTETASSFVLACISYALELSGKS